MLSWWELVVFQSIGWLSFVKMCLNTKNEKKKNSSNSLGGSLEKIEICGWWV